MSAESKPGPAGENSRRDFIQKIGAVAAASTVAANISSAQQPPARVPGLPGSGMADGRNFKPQPGPLSKEPMPTIRLGKHEVGRLLLGVNRVGSHFSDVLSRTWAEWNTPAQRTRVFKHCEELGINLKIQSRDEINQYNKENGGKMLFSCNGYLPITRDGSVGDPRPMLSSRSRWDRSPFISRRAAPTTCGEEARRCSPKSGTGAKWCTTWVFWFASTATSLRCSWRSIRRAGRSITT